jgi:hypothetical protein
MKNMRWTVYILGMKIYKDISKRLIELSQSMYIDKILKLFSMEEYKRGYLHILHWIYLSKNMCPKIQIERDNMERILCVLAIRSIIYAMLYTRPDASYVLSMASRDKFNPGKGHWKIVF